MTTLQRLLSQIETVERLADVLHGTENEIVGEIAVTDGGEPMNCNLDNCSKCAFHVNGHCIMTSEKMKKYLNRQTPDISTDADSVKTNCSTEIIEMRENARKSLMGYVHKQALKFADPDHCADILSNNITLLETIGLFNKGELREQILEELAKKL